MEIRTEMILDFFLKIELLNFFCIILADFIKNDLAANFLLKLAACYFR